MTDESILDQEPFPTLRWDGFGWAGQVLLPAWAGFQTRLGPYCSVSDDAPSTGQARLMVESADPDVRAAPTPAQAAALRHLLANDHTVVQTVLRAIFATYPGLRDAYGYHDEDAEELLPPIASRDELKRLTGLCFVHLLTVENDGLAYAGFELGCTWDEEHGVGVMTHAGRVVKLGGGDTAFEAWIAEQDAAAAR